MSSITFWASIAAKGLRGDRAPTWTARNLRSPVSLALPGVPGQEPESREDAKAKEAGR
jgi:hypothetical protein